MSGVVSWAFEDLTEIALAALTTGESEHLRPFDDRWVGVLASPGNGLSKHVAVGLSVLPPGCVTPVHSHEAEEVAIVLEGNGQIEIGGDTVTVRAGSIVLAPSNVPHQTSASDRLVILWCYAPTGSEERWTQPPSKEE
jgi:quercetin dioxygenase-like cupin family protein